MADLALTEFLIQVDWIQICRNDSKFCVDSSNIIIVGIKMKNYAGMNQKLNKSENLRNMQRSTHIKIPTKTSINSTFDTEVKTNSIDF